VLFKLTYPESRYMCYAAMQSEIPQKADEEPGFLQAGHLIFLSLKFSAGTLPLFASYE